MSLGKGNRYKNFEMTPTELKLRSLKFANLKALLVKSFEEDINPTKNVAVSSTNKLVKILAVPLLQAMAGTQNVIRRTNPTPR